MLTSYSISIAVLVVDEVQRWTTTVQSVRTAVALSTTAVRDHKVTVPPMTDDTATSVVFPLSVAQVPQKHKPCVSRLTNDDWELLINPALHAQTGEVRANFKDTPRICYSN